MKKTIRGILPLLFLSAMMAVPAWGQDEPEPEADPKPEAEPKPEAGTKPPPDAIKLLADITKANADKDTGHLDLLLKSIRDLAESSKDQEVLDQIAAELIKSLKVAKGNFGTQRSIVEVMGALRSKKCLSTLKKQAFRKKAKDVEEQALQACALLSIGKYRDPKMIGALEDETKNRSLPVANAAYEAFQQYGASPGKVRKQVAEILMKRLDSEYPSAGKQGSGATSAEAQERWKKLQETIVKSLQAVCRETTIIDIENWREWWKENKRNAKLWKDKKAT